MYTNKDILWKGEIFCLFYLIAVAYQSYFGKWLDTTAWTSNFGYLKVIYFKGTPSFEDVLTTFMDAELLYLIIQLN